MISLGFEKKITKIVLKLIDKTLGKRFPIIDEITDIFQEQDKRFKDIEMEISAIKEYMKENNNMNEKIGDYLTLWIVLGLVCHFIYFLLTH